jgi:SAM-dependent methyltransferase
MSKKSRWCSDTYPGTYRETINSSIGFSGLGMDMFTTGKVVDAMDLLDSYSGSLAERSICLDIGCGIGVSHPLMASHVGSLAGTDVSSEAIETARSANPDVDYHVCDGGELPFQDACFDFCSTVCVMHHVPTAQWRPFVAEAFRVTRPGGLFAVYEHNPINPMTRWAVWRCPFDHDAVLLRAKRVQALLREQGFEIVVRRYLFFVPFDRPWARRIDKLLRWLPLGAQYVVCGRRPLSDSAGVKDPA